MPYLLLWSGPTKESPPPDLAHLTLLPTISSPWLPCQLNEMVRVVINQLAAWLRDQVVVHEVELLQQVVQVVLVFRLHFHFGYVVDEELEVWLVLVFHPSAIIPIPPSFILVSCSLQLWAFCCDEDLRTDEGRLADGLWKFELDVGALFIVLALLWRWCLVIRVELVLVIFLYVVYLFLPELRRALFND